MQSSDTWLSLKELIEKSKTHKIVYWGCFDYFRKTQKLYDFNPAFIVDLNIHLHGKCAHDGYDVQDPSCLKSIEGKEQYFIIVTTTAFYDVFESLKEYGYTTAQYSATPVLKDMKIIQDIQDVDTDLYFSSSDSKHDDGELGGGIYTLNTQTYEFEKRISGMTRAFTFFKDHVFVNDATKGIRIFDNNLDERDCILMPHNSYLHGMTVDPEKELLYIVQTRTDSIDVIDIASQKIIDNLNIGFIKDKRKDGDYDHHINDICYYDGALLISMFARTRTTQLNWNNGTIVEFDLTTRSIMGDLARDLYMPHSVSIKEGNITFLNSMKGELINNPHSVIATFPGFVRGMDYDGYYYYIAQSTHRHFWRAMEVGNLTSIDCGVYVFDPNTLGTRFIPIRGVHNINTLSLAPD